MIQSYPKPGDLLTLPSVLEIYIEEQGHQTDSISLMTSYVYEPKDIRNVSIYVLSNYRLIYIICRFF